MSIFFSDLCGNQQNGGKLLILFPKQAWNCHFIDHNIVGFKEVSLS